MFTAAEIYSRIGVRTPYYALRNLTIPSRGSATALLPPELPPARELTPLSLTDMSRHLSILGLCAVASTASSPQRRFYLARSATLTWHTTHVLPPTTTPLPGRAVGRFTGARRATAQALLSTDSGIVLGHIGLTYQVLSEPVFARVFSHAHRPGLSHDDGRNPFTQPLPLDNVTANGHTITATVTSHPQQTAGHFYDYPTLPAAVLGGAMCEAASLVLDSLTGSRVCWTPITARFAAHVLPTANQTVTVTACPSDSPAPDDAYAIDVTAAIGKTTVATLTLVVRIHPS